MMKQDIMQIRKCVKPEGQMNDSLYLSKNLILSIIPTRLLFLRKLGWKHQYYKLFENAGNAVTDNAIAANLLNEEFKNLFTIYTF